mmetsp:Transcript_7228/g.27601  ORF Transcript_7228/g.27601 Transcript_7228/m.27601 type:complete len:263 (-) Transcript_7228:14-802(-)
MDAVFNADTIDFTFSSVKFFNAAKARVNNLRFKVFFTLTLGSFLCSIFSFVVAPLAAVAFIFSAVEEFLSMQERRMILFSMWTQIYVIEKLDVNSCKAWLQMWLYFLVSIGSLAIFVVLLVLPFLLEGQHIALIILINIAVLVFDFALSVVIQAVVTENIKKVVYEESPKYVLMAICRVCGKFCVDVLQGICTCQEDRTFYYIAFRQLAGLLLPCFAADALLLTLGVEMEVFKAYFARYLEVTKQTVNQSEVMHTVNPMLAR